jgi:carboxypeptidase C (cathepsin A)
MEGFYDLATPFFAADYTIDHLNLGSEFHKNISFATYEAGHMVYVENASHAKMKKDLVDFMQSAGAF